MKTSSKIAIAAVIIFIAVAIIGFFVWKKSKDKKDKEAADAIAAAAQKSTPPPAEGAPVGNSTKPKGAGAMAFADKSGGDKPKVKKAAPKAQSSSDGQYIV
jgi:flagellar basal body-associated protein FliL